MNVEGSRGPGGRRRASWASSASCSPPPARTTAAWPIPPCPIDEDGRAALRCRSTPSRRWASRTRCCSATAPAPLRPTCLRFATVYGVGPRMRFDLTVNEFTRDLWADRQLEVFGERFWRPYVHVRDAARAVRTVLEAPPEAVAGKVFNVGDIGRELPQARPGGDHHRRSSDRGEVEFVSTGRGPARLQGLLREDPRRARLRGARTRVPDGIDEIVGALEQQRFERSVRWPLPERDAVSADRADSDSSTSSWATREIAAVEATLRSGWLTMGPRTKEFEAAFAEHLGVKHAVALSSCTAALHLAYLAAGVGPGRRGDRSRDHVRGHGQRRHATAAATPVIADVVGQHDLGLDPDDVARRVDPAHQGGLRRPLRRVRRRPRGSPARSATSTASR